jgi:hypothetical protein
MTGKQKNKIIKLKANINTLTGEGISRGKEYDVILLDSVMARYKSNSGFWVNTTIDDLYLMFERRKIVKAGALPLTDEELKLFSLEFYGFLKHPITKIEFISVPEFNHNNQLQCKTMQEDGNEIWFRIKDCRAMEWIFKRIDLSEAYSCRYNNNNNNGGQGA